MLKGLFARLLAMLFGLAVAWAICTLAIVRLVQRDADGNRHMRSLYLKPYRLPLRKVDDMVKRYHSSSTSTVYSPELGWDARAVNDTTPGFRASRPDIDYAHVPPRDTIRIMLFGDSFTACATAESETWGHDVESDLNARGVPVQVLNFGLGGYGMDQAYLRWRQYGAAYHPDIVLFGLQPEDALRNLNLIRLLYAPATELPFSKPRFVLSGDSLELVNSPALPPDSLEYVLAHLGKWPLLRYETFYDPRDYRNHWFLESTLVAFTGAVLRERSPRRRIRDRASFTPSGESGRLALAILDRFHAEVTAEGASFHVVNLPRREDLGDRSKNRPFAYDSLLLELDRRYGVIDAGETLVRGAPEMKLLFRTDQHYNARGNRLVADAVVAYFEEHGLGVQRVAAAAARR